VGRRKKGEKTMLTAAILMVALAGAPTETDQAANPPTGEAAQVAATAANQANVEAEKDAKKAKEKAKQREVQTPPPVHEELQVTATRYEVDSFQTPIPISVVSADQLQRDMPEKMVDALKMLPGVDISGEGPFRGLPVIRGMSSNRVLILVDGQRLNNSRESTEFAGIQPGLVDLSQVERIEIIRGPASVLYGSDAIGGAINIITKQQAFTQGAFTLGGGVNYEYGDSASSNRGQFEVNGAGERVTFHFSASAFEAKNYTSPEGVVPNSGMKDRAFDGNVRYLVSDNAVLRLDMQATQARDVGFPGYDPATSGIDISFPRFDRNKIGFTYDSGPVLGLSSLSVSGYWQGVVKDSILNFNFVPTFFSDNFTHSVINTWGFNVHSGTNAGGGRLTFGLDFYQDNLHDDTQESSILGSDNNVAVPNSYQRGLGLYVQDEVPVTSRLKLVAGVRGDSYSFVSRDDPRYTGQPFDLSQTAGSGNVSALYQVTDRVALTALVGHGFRAPNIEERSFFGVSTDGTVLIQQNPQLRSETSLNSEVGFKVRYQQFSGGFSVYHNAARDFIDLVYTGTDPTTGLQLAHFGNIDRATIQGAEFELNWYPSQHWTAFGNIAYSRGTDDKTGEPLALIAPLKSVLGVRYQATRWWGEAATRMVARQDRVPQDQVETPGFAVLDLRGGYDFTGGLTVQAAVENAGNTAYIEPFNVRLEPGRNFRLMLGYKF
jgi:hemoglobin/transferrin/lactoferrin receptor protein